MESTNERAPGTDVIERTRAALADAAVSNAQDRTTSLAKLRHAMALLWRCHPEPNPRFDALELERRLREPVEAWLEAVVRGPFNGPLIADGEPTELCHQWRR